MKKYMLMTLATATALSSIAAHAASAAPLRADMMVEDFADVSREERRAERQEARANPTPPADVINRAAPQRDNKRAERPRDIARTERPEARQDSRYYDRNRDGDLDRRWDRNRDGSLDRNWDRNRDGRLDRRFDRNDDERIDRRYDRNRDGRLDQNKIGRWTHNWRKYREQNRNYFRPGRYHAPYRDQQYRLPAAYGSYRWVRYYDDVLLVDVRNGHVVDVIRDFFW
jgi:hypothetical protein